MFVFDHNGNAITIPYQNIKIEWLNSNTYFRITDDTGTIYTFGDTQDTREITRVDYDSDNNKSGRQSLTYNSTWHLNRIFNQEGVAARFAYIVSDTVSYSTTSYTCDFRVDDDDRGTAKGYHEQSYVTETTIAAPKFLSEITAGKNKLQLAYTNQIATASQTMRLDTVRYSYDNVPHNEIVFGYGDFPTNRYLRLNNINDVVNGTATPIYSFEYNTTTNLPGRNSMDFDHWGYFNNAGNDSFLPTIECKDNWDSSYYQLVKGNREPDSIATQANILTRINYGTGNSTAYEYELNSRSAGNENVAHGGLRIKSISDVIDGKSHTKSYSYDKPGGGSSGVAVNPDQKYHTWVRVDITNWWQMSDNYCTQFFISDKPIDNLFDATGNHIEYEYITETFPDGSYIVNQYSTVNQDPDINGTIYPAQNSNDHCAPVDDPVKSSRSWRRGHLKSKTSYNSSGELVEKITNTHVNLSNKATIKSYIPVSGYRQGVKIFDWRSEAFVLSKVEVSGSNTDLATTTVFEYNPITLYPVKTRTTDANGDIYEVRTKYSADYNTSMFSDGNTYGLALKFLQDNRILNIPLEHVTFKNGNVVDGELKIYNYDTFSTMHAYEEKKYKLRLDTPLGTFTMSEVKESSTGSDDSGITFSDKYVLEEHLDQHYGGNVLSSVTSNGQRESFIYSSDGLYMIAKVANATHSKIQGENEVFHTSFEDYQGPSLALYFANAKSGDYVLAGSLRIDLASFKLGNYMLSYWEYNTQESVPEWQKIEVPLTIDGGTTLYTIYGSTTTWIDEVRIMPKDAKMITYTYKYPYGKTSETDNSGRTLRYYYDAATGLLTSVKDGDTEIKTITYDNYTYPRKRIYNRINENEYVGTSYKKRRTTHYDQKGRPSQIIDLQASPDRKDVVSFLEYDRMGRSDSIQYLPYVSGTTTADKRAAPVSEQLAFYQSLGLGNDASYAYVETKYDDSPLSLVKETSMPGSVNSMQSGHTDKYNYRLNVANEVKRYSLILDSVLCYNGYYIPGTLKVVESTTEISDGVSRHTYEYRNSQDFVIANAVEVDGERRTTYYVYDDLGRQRYVIPPIADNTITSVGSTYNPYNSDRKELWYYTKYDKYGRITKLLKPGSGWETYQYDSRHRMTMKQDANQKKDKLWHKYEYDDQNRIIEESIVKEVDSNIGGIVGPSVGVGGIGSGSVIGGGIGVGSIGSGGIGSIFTPVKIYQPHEFISSHRFEGASYSQGPVDNCIIMTEIMYDTPLNEQTASDPRYCEGEYIQLFNAGDSAVNLTGWKITKAGSTEQYVFPTNTIIIPKSSLIVAYRPKISAFQLSYLYPHPSLTVNANKILYQSNLTLPNSSTTISLIDNQGKVKDKINYHGTSTTSSPYPLRAENTNVTVLVNFVALRRNEVQFDINGCAIPNNLHWSTEKIAPFMEIPIVTDYANKVPEKYGEFEIPAYLAFEPVATVVTASDVVKLPGLSKYSKVAYFDPQTNISSIVESAYYYDKEARVIQVVSKNHLGGISRLSTKYNYIGNPLTIQESHQLSANAAPDIKLTTYVYDMYAGERLLSETTRLNNSAYVTVSYTYDKLGRMASKRFGDNGTVETYTYDVGGRLQSQDSEVFMMNIKYSLIGNVSGISWQNKMSDNIIDGKLSLIYILIPMIIGGNLQRVSTVCL